MSRSSGAFGLEAGVVFAREFLELGGIFIGNDSRLRVDAGFQGIEARFGLALSGARASRFLCIQAIGLDLFERCHKEEVRREVRIWWRGRGALVALEAATGYMVAAGRMGFRRVAL